MLAARFHSVSWVPVRPPIAAARPVICHGPPEYRLLMLLPAPKICHGPLYHLLMLLRQGPECVMGPCTASIAAVSIATLCHVPLSGLLTLLVGSILS
ncbi:unnamed protein product [Staurois parvus]|uniref:Uncharacterized protein n=1 Tax=Staurois parvus TaxID=386267 RepID=A0ABN9CM36_9NEOB|nr:unnamed protein product [Staurois parvus]